MSRVEELTQELCPNGVQFSPLGCLCEVLNGYAFKSNLFNSDEIGLPLIRIRDVNTGLSGTYYSGEYEDRYIVNAGDILIGMDGDFRAVRWKHERSLLNQRVCRLQNFAAKVIPDFIYYKIQDELDRISSSVQGSTVKHLSSKDLDRSLLPVPPIEVQREIVNVLDAFSKLEAELEAELEARRIQYTFYRDSLLASSRHLKFLMGDVGVFHRGRRFTKKDVVEAGIPAIHYGEIYTHYGVSTDVTVTQVRTNLASQLLFAEPGDVVIATVGETVEDVAKAVAWLGKVPVAIHDDTAFFRSELNPKYVSYAMQTANFHTQKNKHVARGKVKRLSGDGLSKIAIPVPSREEQDRIVGILDKFDALVNDLSSGLPAELNARRQQYEHYRDRLLTFQEAG